MISRRALVAGSGALLLPKQARAVVMMPSTPNMAFPGGRAPGFDQNHVAVSGGGVCRFSAVNFGTSMISLLSGLAPGSGTSTATVFGFAPFCVSGANTPLIFTSRISSVSEVAFTLAFIAYATATTNLCSIIGFGVTGTNGYAIRFGSGGNLSLAVGSTATAGPNYSANVPYFGLVGRQGTGTNQGLFLLKRLDNGKITIATANIVTAETAPTAQFEAVQSTSAGQMAASAVAYIGGVPSLAMYQTWALDPWSFWYPRTLLDLTQ